MSAPRLLAKRVRSLVAAILVSSLIAVPFPAAGADSVSSTYSRPKSAAAQVIPKSAATGKERIVVPPPARVQPPPKRGSPPSSGDGDSPTRTQPPKRPETPSRPEIPPRPETPSRPETPRPPSRGTNWVPWVVLGGIGASAIASQMQNQARASDASLAETGPRVPDGYSRGSFPVQGYTRGGWPLVVDFRPEPESRTWVEVAVDGQVRHTRLLDEDGRRGRQQVRIDLPPGISDVPRPGLYVIRSARLADGRIQRDASGKDVAAHVEIFGIGAGPKAVGSVAIDEVVFEPGQLRFNPSARDRASYSYTARSEFNRAAVEILKFDNRNGEIKVERVKSENLVGVRLGRSPRGDWDGTRDGAPGASVGLHRLQVRAWFNSEDRSWVGAWSPSAVIVSQ